MAELTSLDVRFLARELSRLHGAKVEKIVQSEDDKRDLLFTLYHKDFPKIHLRFMLPGLVCVLEEKPDTYPKAPPGFAMFLRKYLGSARLAKAEQRGFDRLLMLGFERGGESMTLAAELIPPGNMLLLLPDGTIKGLLETHSFKDRTLRGGIVYTSPPAAFDPEAASEEEIADRIATSGKSSAVTSLAIGVGLGGVYAEEACAVAGIDKKRDDLTQAEILALARAVRSLFGREIAPHRDASRVYPFAMMSRDTIPCAQKTFLAALGAMLDDETGKGAGMSAQAKAQAAAKAPKSKMQVMIDAQQKRIVALEKESLEEQRKGELVYEQYGPLSAILSAAQQARQKKQDIAAALAAFPQVTRYDPATGEIEVEVERG